MRNIIEQAPILADSARKDTREFWRRVLGLSEQTPDVNQTSVKAKAFNCGPMLTTFCATMPPTKANTDIAAPPLITTIMRSALLAEPTGVMFVLHQSSPYYRMRLPVRIEPSSKFGK